MFGQTMSIGMQPLFFLAIALILPIKAFFGKMEAIKEASFFCPLWQQQTTQRYTVYTWNCRGRNKRYFREIKIITTSLKVKKILCWKSVVTPYVFALANYRTAKLCAMDQSSKALLSSSISFLFVHITWLKLPKYSCLRSPFFFVIVVLCLFIIVVTKSTEHR